MAAPPRCDDEQVKRALVVIDVQNEYIDGNLPIAYPPLSVSLPNVERAMDAAHDAGLPVVVVRQVAPAASPIFGAGSHGAELHASVAGRPRDLVLDKTLPSCFTGTGLGEWLAERGIDTLAICGYMTQNCDESTAREAAHRGLAVEFLSDATGTLALGNEAGTVDARTLHEAVLVVLHSRFAAVVATDDWLAAVADDRPLAGSSVYASTAVARA